MGKLEDYAQLPTIMRAYLAELHSLCPAARAYTFEMLWEDFRCVSYSYPPAVPSHGLHAKTARRRRPVSTLRRL